MAFYAQIRGEDSSSDLESTLNSKLAQYTGVTAVPGCGIGYGNGKNRGAVLVEASGTGGSSNEVSVKVWSDKSLSTVVSDISSWLSGSSGENMTVLGLSLYYDKNKDKYKVLVPYLAADTSTTYSVGYEKDGSASDSRSDVDNELDDATQVAGFGFTYCDKSYVEIYIYVDED